MERERVSRMQEAKGPFKEVISNMQKSWLDCITSLFEEGHLDGTFVELYKLNDKEDPKFMGELMPSYLEQSEKYLNDIKNILEKEDVDFNKVLVHLYPLKGGSESLGAQKVVKSCIALRTSCEEKNIDKCQECLQQVMVEYWTLRYKLDELIKIEHEIASAGEKLPIKKW